MIHSSRLSEKDGGGGGEEVVNIIFQPFQKIEIQPSPKKKKKKKKKFLKHINFN